MADISEPVDLATRLEDIGFAEFTANLVLKVFNGLVAANLSQTEAYLQLVQSVAKTLKDYVDGQHQYVSGAQVLEFLSTALTKSSESTPAELGDGTQLELKTGDATAVNEALELPTASGGIGTNNQVAKAGTLAASERSQLFEAVARRISANQYDLLKEMVKQGVLRLVVTRGVIETKLTFSASVSKLYQASASSYNSQQFNFAAKASTGAALSKWVKASASANYTSVSIRTTNERQQDYSGSSVNIFGSVLIEFKTDYLPLAA